MLTIPFEVLSVSWPRPIDQRDGRWVSEPEWNAPAAPLRPQPAWTLVDGQPLWLIDWCAVFRSGGMGGGGEMRDFHIVFRVRVLADGPLAFWSDDGCIIRRAGRIVHEDREAHPLRPAELDVHAGDVLEIAHWQLYGEWKWAAASPGAVLTDPLGPFRAALPAVEERLRRPEGPPLKLFTSGAGPLRAVLAVYSMVLNGYAPDGVLLYGGHQWSARARDLFRELLPFAREVDSGEVLLRARTLGGGQLADWCRRYWWVFKSCMALLQPPEEFAVIDDDVVVLDPVDDALAALQERELVFTPDIDWSAIYLRVWGRVLRVGDLRGNGIFNAGLYWCRRVLDARALAAAMSRVPPHAWQPYHWEQGFIATVYAPRTCLALPRQRYFFPLIEGLPGGMLGYDYAANPCGFTSVHFGGVVKPDDMSAALIAGAVLTRRPLALTAPEPRLVAALAS